VVVEVAVLVRGDVVVVVVVVVVVLVEVAVRVGVVTETPTEVVRVWVFSTVVVVFELVPLARAYAMPPPISRATTTANAIQPPLSPRRGRRSAPQLAQ
jgi:hypothetical protein